MKPRAPESEPVPQRSPWHAGERLLQQREGVAERMQEIGHKFVRDFMTEQHRTFFAQLPFLVIGAVDAHGAAWASLLSGEPGFVSSADATTLRVAALPRPGDPLREALVPGASMGALGIELHTRRRNRANGLVRERAARGFTLAIRQSFGNCPQYIQARQLAADRPAAPEGRPVECLSALDAAARAMIRAADTFFVASYVEAEADGAERAVDVSHRGGLPGFVRVDGDVLTIPDFAGNLQFNTLGNLLLQPRAGLCFVDFSSGDLLQLSGTTEVVLEGPEIAAFAGAERLWRFRVQALVRQPGALGLRFRFRDYSPFTLRTGTWDGRG